MILIKYGGKLPSKRPGIGGDHNCCNKPKMVITVVRVCRKRDCSIGFAVRRNDQSQRIADLGSKKENEE